MGLAQMGLPHLGYSFASKIQLEGRPNGNQNIRKCVFTLRADFKPQGEHAFSYFGIIWASCAGRGGQQLNEICANPAWVPQIAVIAIDLRWAGGAGELIIIIIIEQRRLTHPRWHLACRAR